MSTQLWRRVALGVAGGAVGYLAARAVRRTVRTGSVWTAEDLGPRSYRRAVTIYRPPAEVYAFWRDLPNLAQALGPVIRVDEAVDGRSRWIVEGPGRSEVEFMVEVCDDEPQRLIGWRADDAPVPHLGRVEFSQAPGGRGTEVRLHVTLPPGVRSDAAIGPLTGDQADRMVYDALRRVKQIMEAGEVIRVDGRSGGRDAVPWRAIAAAVPQSMTGGRA